jgi:hypothetical protein
MTLTESQRMALLDLVAEYIRTPGHTEVFIDVGRRVETTPESLLLALMGDECVCRTRGCGHVASAHGAGGDCSVCGREGCWL